RSGGFETPLGVAAIDADVAEAIAAATRVVRDHDAAHRSEHSLEMQLPFVQRLAPQARIVPLIMGYQTGDTAYALGDALARALAARDAIVLDRADSGYVSGDKSAVVGYMAAALGNFSDKALHHGGHG